MSMLAAQPKFKVNLHITNKCNYHCKHCFADFEDKELSLREWELVFQNLKASGIVNSVNFAGGEPFLYEAFDGLLAMANGFGFTTSVITNGSFLRDGVWIPKGFFKKISMLGISINSFDKNTLLSMGCATKGGDVVTKQHLLAICHMALSENPRLAIKFNTVVTQCNKEEVLVGIEKEIPVARWKFLRIKPYSSCRGSGRSNQNFVVTESEFSRFCERNKTATGVEIAENNMGTSYILVSADGSLMDTRGEKYIKVGNLLERGLDELLPLAGFDVNAYLERY